MNGSAPRRDGTCFFEADPTPSLPRRALAEAIGAFGLVFVVVSASFCWPSSSMLGPVGRALAVAPTLTGLILLFGAVSGGHYNPLISLTQALRRRRSLVCLAAVIESQADMLLVGEAQNGIEAIENFGRFRPDVTLMDLQMPDMGGVEAIEKIRAAHPNARIIVLTTYVGDVQAMWALKAGAVAYLLKSSLRRNLLDTIRSVHRGQRHLQPEIAAAVALAAVNESLSQRETDVLQLAANGNSNKRIAHELGLSEETIKTHMKSILAKLQVTDRTHAVAVAARRGIINL